MPRLRLRDLSLAWGATVDKLAVFPSAKCYFLSLGPWGSPLSLCSLVLIQGSGGIYIQILKLSLLDVSLLLGFAPHLTVSLSSSHKPPKLYRAWQHTPRTATMQISPGAVLPLEVSCSLISVPFCTTLPWVSHVFALLCSLLAVRDAYVHLEPEILPTTAA